MAAQRIQLRRDTAAEWQKVNPVLSSGEPGVETDTGKWKIGDGTLAWKALPYKAEVGPPGANGATGPAGASGPSGPAGPKGDTGAAGPAGPSNTLSIGSVVSGPSAFASLSGTAPAQTLNLSLPKGDKGDPCSLSIGTVQAGATAAATITGTAPNYVLNLSVPKGETGPQGAQGNKGDTGAQGPQGVQGPTGATGPAGDQGPQGIKGDTGATGVQGPKGDTGAAAKIMGEATKWPPATTPAVGDLWIADDPLPTGFPAGSAAGDGFVWTGTIWLNAGPIRGPKGDPGPKGDIGATGPAGAAGATGPTGAAGPAGAKGDTGATGPAGSSASLTVGTVTSGDIPSVTVTGTAPNQLVNFVLAKGAKGDTGLTGPIGPQGPAGPSNILRIGLVTTGDTPNATISGTSPSQTLSFVLPKAQSNTLAIGNVSAGLTASATITGTAPNQVLNLVLPQAQINQQTSFYSIPVITSAIEGDYVTFYSGASSTDFPIIYQWQYSDDPSQGEASWYDRPGGGDSSLTMLARDERNTRYYRNTATTPSGTRAVSSIAQLTIIQKPVDVTGVRAWGYAQLPDSTDFLFNYCKCLPKIRIDGPSVTTGIGGWTTQRSNAQIFFCNGTLFTSSHCSKDGVTWKSFIGGPGQMYVGGHPTGPQHPILDTIVYFPEVGCYMMWCSMPIELVRKLIWGDAGFPTDINGQPDLDALTLAEVPYQYRYWSQDGISWEHDDTYDASGQLTGQIRWESIGQYTLSKDGKEMIWLSGTPGGGVERILWKATSPTKKTVVDQWSEGSPEAATKNPFGKARYPYFFKRINGVDAATYDINYWMPAIDGFRPPPITSIGKAQITPTKLPQPADQREFTCPRILGFEYGMVAGSMAYVVYCDDGNFYYTRDPESTTPLIQLARPPGTLCCPMPAYGNGWWVITTPVNNTTYYTAKDLADPSWYIQSLTSDYNFGWNEQMRPTPMVFVPNPDPKLAGRFVLAGHYAEDNPYIRNLLQAE